MMFWFDTWNEITLTCSGSERPWFRHLVDHGDPHDTFKRIFALCHIGNGWQRGFIADDDKLDRNQQD